jgi:hypothetical protein
MFGPYCPHLESSRHLERKSPAEIASLFAKAGLDEDIPELRGYKIKPVSFARCEIWEQIGNDNWGQQPFMNGYFNQRIIGRPGTQK